MRDMLMCSLLLLILVLSCGAIAQVVELSGTHGQAVLSQLTGSARATNISPNSGQWNWGDIPMGYTLNQTGQLIPVQNVLTNDFGGWIPNI